MDPLDTLRLLRRRWWVWLTVLLISLGTAVLSLPRDGEVSRGPLATAFTARHTLLQAPDAVTTVNLELTRLFAVTGQIPRLAAVSLGRPAEEGPLLAARVSVTADEKVGSLELSVTGTDGREAARTANAFAEAVKESLRSRADEARRNEVTSAQAQLSGLEQRVLDLQRRIAGEPLEAPLLEAQRQALTNSYQVTFERLQSLQGQGAATSPLATLQEAVPIPVPATGSPVPTSPRARIGLALLVGLVLGIALALALERLDTRLRTREQVELATGLPVVAEIPRLPRKQRAATEVAVVVAPTSGVAEAYRGLRATLLLVPSRLVVRDGPEAPPVDLTSWSPPQVLLVTSPSPSDGKTSTVVNLAAALAESGRSVLVLDADFRKPMANRYLGVPRSAGLSDLLDLSQPGRVTDMLRWTGINGVQMVTSGTSSRTPAAMLSHLGAVIDEARTLADVVIIDAAPMLAANDATDITPFVDSVVLVAQAGRTTAPSAQRAVDLLARLAVPVLGVVVQSAAEADGADYLRGYREHRPADDAGPPAGPPDPAAPSSAGHAADISLKRLTSVRSALGKLGSGQHATDPHRGELARDPGRREDSG